MSSGRSRDSLGFAAFVGGRQVGFARVVTDQATFAWICDVFVDESVRGRGVGKRLMAAILADPRLQGLKRMMLATDDAHGLYAGFGFEALGQPEKWMSRMGQRALGGRDRERTTRRPGGSGTGQYRIAAGTREAPGRAPGV